MQFGGGPKVPTFGSGPAADTDKGGPKVSAPVFNPYLQCSQLVLRPPALELVSALKAINTLSLQSLSDGHHPCIQIPITVVNFLLQFRQYCSGRLSREERQVSFMLDTAQCIKSSDTFLKDVVHADPQLWTRK